MYKKRRKKKALQLKTQTVPDCLSLELKTQSELKTQTDLRQFHNSTKIFTTANTPKLPRAARLYTCLRQWGGGWIWWSVSVNCTLAHIAYGVSEGDVPYQKLKMLYFWNGNLVIYMGNISKNLDQAMSKKKVAEEGGGKHKEKTHTVLLA